MGLTRLNVGLLLLVGALLAVQLTLDPPRLRGASDDPLAPGLLRAGVARIQIRAADGASGVDLRRVDGTWRVAELWDHPAYPWAIESLVESLAGLRTGETVARGAEQHERYGVGGEGLRVHVATESEHLATFVVGVPPDDVAEGIPRAARTVFARLANEDVVVRAARLRLPETRPGAWIEPTLVALEPDVVTGLEAGWRGTTARLGLDLTRSGDATWTVPTDPGAPAVPDTLLRALFDAALGLVAADVASASAAEDDGLWGDEAEWLALTDASGERIELRFGADAAGDLRLAMRADGERPWVLHVPRSSVGAVLSALDAIAEVLGEERAAALGRDR